MTKQVQYICLKGNQKKGGRLRSKRPPFSTTKTVAMYGLESYRDAEVHVAGQSEVYFCIICSMVLAIR